MKKLALTPPTSGGHSVGIVLSRTQTTEFSFFIVVSLPSGKSPLSATLNINTINGTQFIHCLVQRISLLVSDLSQINLVHILICYFSWNPFYSFPLPASKWFNVKIPFVFLISIIRTAVSIPDKVNF
jgi:hypothetical protein